MPLPPTPSFSPLADPGAVVSVPKARFTVLASRLLRLEYSPTNTFEDRPSQAFWYRLQPVPPFTQTITAEAVEIETDDLLLHYHPSRLGFTRQTLSITLKQSGVTWHYGDSARLAGNLKGTARTLDGDFGLTRLEDGLLSKAGWVVVDDAKSLVFNPSGWLEPRYPKAKPARTQDLYFFGYGTDYAACLGDYTRLAGPIPMIPRYILGNWWSRYWAYTQEELQALMIDFRAHEIPLSVCIVDMDWHLTQTGNTSDGWTGYTWNRQLFPDPPAFIHWLHAQGLRTALNLHPARGIHPHEAQYAQMARWMGLDPAIQTPIPFDITDPRFVEGYFELLHHPYEIPSPVVRAANAERDAGGEGTMLLSPSGGSETRGEGVDFWWMDWQQGRKSRLPGLDPLWWINHLHYHDLGRDGQKRPFVFSRWGGLGNHRYPIGFSGDTIIRWSTLANQPYFTATAANVGYGWWSHDIGGHMGKDQTPELYTRWVQFGVFSPIFRLHSTNKAALDRRPWGKPDRYYRAAREVMQLRHALIPYLYSMAWRAHRTGVALVTPMYYGHMDEPAAFEAKDQYFFGTELIVAPYLTPADPHSGLATRQVWLPVGRWYNFFTGAPFDGGQWHTLTGTLEDIPVFAKAGAILPLGPKVGWGGIDNPAELDIYHFPAGSPPQGVSNRFELYEDDGETTGYLAGEYALTPLSIIGQGRALSFTLHPAEGHPAFLPARRTYRLHLRGVDERTTASLPGHYDPATRTLSLAPVILPAGQGFTMTWEMELEN